MVAGAYIKIEVLEIPCVVDSERVTARTNRERNLVTEQKFALEFTIKENHDLPSLEVFGSITSDGNSTVIFLIRSLIRAWFY